jgi:hypothetical protein
MDIKSILSKWRYQSDSGSNGYGTGAITLTNGEDEITLAVGGYWGTFGWATYDDIKFGDTLNKKIMSTFNWVWAESSFYDNMDEDEYHRLIDEDDAIRPGCEEEIANIEAANHEYIVEAAMECFYDNEYDFTESDLVVMGFIPEPEEEAPEEEAQPDNVVIDPTLTSIALEMCSKARLFNHPRAGWAYWMPEDYFDENYLCDLCEANPTLDFNYGYSDKFGKYGTYLTLSYKEAA